MTLGSLSRVEFEGLTPEGAVGYLKYPLVRVHCALGPTVTEGRETVTKESL